MHVLIYRFRHLCLSLHAQLFLGNLHMPYAVRIRKKRMKLSNVGRIYFLLLSENSRSSPRSSESLLFEMKFKTSATPTLWFITKLLNSDASPGLIMLVRTIESIRSSNSEQIDCLSGLQNPSRNI